MQIPLAIPRAIAAALPARLRFAARQPFREPPAGARLADDPGSAGSCW